MRIALALLTASVALAQEFEVASIHPTPPEVRQVVITSAQGEFRAQNVPVRQLIEHAYQLRPFQLKGGEGWIDSERYTIAATPTTSEADGRRKLQALLQERFGLRLQITQEEQRVHGLVVADRSRLRPAKQPGETFATIMPEAGGQLRVRFASYPLKTMAAALSQEIEQLVVDETGMEELFDFEFMLEGSLDAPAPPPLRMIPALPDFGLKLESRRGMVDVYTIEDVHRPSEN